MTGHSTTTLARALFSDASATAAPEWVHLVPAADRNGAIEGRDGRNFFLSDPAALVADFEGCGLDLVVDYGHAEDKPAGTGPVPAAGWIKALQAREDGIWGRVEWTARASELIAAREYRYLSPTILFDKATREIMRLKGAGLVHRPNLALTALNAEEPAMPPAPTDTATPKDLFQTLVAFFGLPADATIAQVMAALGGVKAQLTAPPDPAKYMPVAAVTALMAERRAELAQANAGRAHLKVDTAFRQGYIHGGMRDWALALCQSDEPAFDAFLSMSGPTFGGLLKNHGAALSGTPASPRAALRSEAADAICAQLGLAAGSLTK